MNSQTTRLRALLKCLLMAFTIVALLKRLHNTIHVPLPHCRDALFLLLTIIIACYYALNIKFASCLFHLLVVCGLLVVNDLLVVSFLLVVSLA